MLVEKYDRLQMKFGLVLCNHPASAEGLDEFFRGQIEQVKLAEKFGGDAALVCEHHFEGSHLPSPLIAATAIAFSTKRIRVGTGIILLALYNPLRVAEDAATIDSITGGRMILAVGHGYREEEFAGYGVPLNERFSRVEEGVNAVRALWSAPKASFSGKYYSYKDITLAPRPVQKPHPPIWVAAKAENAVRQAARIGDAWFSDPVTPLSVLKDRYKLYRETLKKHGKEFNAIERPLFREVYVSTKAEDEAWEEVKRYGLVTYGHYYKWGHFLDESGRAVDPSTASFEEFQEKLKQRFVVGNPDQCVEKLSKLQEELEVTEVICRMQFPNMPQEMAMNSIRLLGEKVISQMKN